MQTDEPRPAGGADDEIPGGDAADTETTAEEEVERDRSLGAAWRRAGLAFGDIGSDVGDSLRRAWAASGEQEGDEPADGLRRLAELFERSVDTARSTATSPEARAQVNASARRAGERLEHAVRLSLAELGRTLERARPEERPARRDAGRPRNDESALD